MNPIIGRWTGNGEVLIFEDKKKMQYDDMSGKWFTRGSYLTMEIKSRIGHVEKHKRKFILNGNKLEIEGQDGQMITYRRRKV